MLIQLGQRPCALTAAKKGNLLAIIVALLLELLVAHVLAGLATVAPFVAKVLTEALARDQRPDVDALAFAEF